MGMSAMRTGILVMVCVLLSAICLVSTASAQTNWQRTYGGAREDLGFCVQQTADGGFIVVGFTDSYPPGVNVVYLIRANGSGDTLWTRTYGGPTFAGLLAVAQTADGGFVVTGGIINPDADNDVCLIRTNASGDTLWTRTYGGTGDDCGSSVQQTADGGFVITGYTAS
jgi:hypothetical protein